MMSPQFIGREIKVTVSDEVKVPTSFYLDNREFIISEIIAAWPDYGFGSNQLHHKKWWQRHHRNYYRVKSASGEVFEIYYDRGTNLKHREYKKWFLYRQL
jgi:hypothetical protein